MKRSLFILVVVTCLFQSALPQVKMIYCLNDPGLSPYYFAYRILADSSENKIPVKSAIGLNHFEWAPDGSKIACVGYQNMETSWSVYVFDLAGGNLTRLTKVERVLDGALSWSPDGDKIIFTRSYPIVPGRSHELWIMNADGSNQHFSGIYGFQPMWSPDGTRLVYCALKSGNWEIYTADIDGNNEIRLTTNPATDLNPVWSPDGTRIAFMSERPGNSEVFVMNADGTRPVRLTMNPGYDGMPRWSPDGNQLAFNSEVSEDQQIEIFLINSDGSDLRRLTHSASNNRSINPAWCPVQAATGKEDPEPFPSGYFLDQNYPNPFGSSTSIDYIIDRCGHVHLDVMNLSGRQIARLVDDEKGPGKYSVIWDGKDPGGMAMGTGIYMYCLTGEHFAIRKKALLIRKSA